MARSTSRARLLRELQTDAERKLWSALRSRRLDGHKFRRQHPIDRFIVDFVCLDSRLIVEVDGATHSTDAELSKDAGRTRILESLGFHLIRVTNADIRENLAGVLTMILREVSQFHQPD